MHKVKRITSVNMFALVDEIMNLGGSARITITGSSMQPFLRGDVDSVELIRADYINVQRGDIVLVARDNGQYILHRIVKKDKDSFYLAGDAQRRIEGPLMADQLIAKVKSVWRGEKHIDCSSIWWKLCSELWLYLLPLRYMIVKAYRKIRKDL